MPRKRVATEPPPRARKNAPKRTRSGQDQQIDSKFVCVTTNELASKRKGHPDTIPTYGGPFVADDLDEEDDDGPDETATIET